MGKLKLLLIGFLALTTLIIILLGSWFWNVRNEVAARLASKKFLPPTEYYSAPEVFYVTKATRDQLETLLNSKTYQNVTVERPLQPGEYSLLDREACQKNIPTPLSENITRCMLIALADTPDPMLKERALQWAAFDSADQLAQAGFGNPLQNTEEIFLEPQLVAQYIGAEPILQSHVSLGQIPTQCLNAVLSIEDAHYLEHSGISIAGFLRAIYKNVVGRGYAQGGSTITQQLVKNYFLTPEKTISRKLNEMAMAIALETFISKDQIFETYLNIIYLGQNGPFQVRGFPAASRYYFNKPISDLNLAECSLMAAVLNNPGQLNPFTKPDNARKRRAQVLKKMLEYQFISENERAESEAAALPTHSAINISETAPYYLDFVRKELAANGIDSTGKSIFTGLKPTAQFAAQSAVRQQLDNLEQSNKKIATLKAKGSNLEGVLLAADNKTGLIEAIVGGRSFKLTQFNRAWEAHRQVGSIMKPFVFLTALIQKPESYSPTTILPDARFTVSYEGQSWSPENYEGKYFGDVPMYFALKNSLNCATASVGMAVGLPPIIDIAQKAGLHSTMKPVPSVTLGAFEMRAPEVLEAYQTFARMGAHRRATSIRAVLDETGTPISLPANELTQVLPEVPTAELVGMMMQTPISGSAKLIKASGYAPATAGKTGTTSDNKDAWFGGFTPNTTTIAWVGYDNNTPHGLTGASGPVPIWLAYMKQAHPQDANDFQWPAGVKDSDFTFDNKGTPEVVHLKVRQ